MKLLQFHSIINLTAVKLNNAKFLLRYSLNMLQSIHAA